MSTINVLVGIDCETIIANYTGGTESSPTAVSNSNFYMIVNQANALSGQAGGELNVAGNIGDNLRWRAESLSLNFDYDAVFVQFVQTGGGSDLMTLPPQLIGGAKSGGGAFTKNAPLPLNSTGGGDVFSTENVDQPYYFYQSTLESTGKVTYHWVVQIFDSSGNSLGYFQWDPYITISN